MIVIELIYNLSVLVALSVLSGFIDIRYKRNSLLAKILQGILFGLTAIIGMMNPFILTEGIIFDGRSIVISLCTLFFGPISGAIAALSAIGYRYYLGGGGLTMGLLVISSSYLIGVFFNNIKIKSRNNVITNFRLYLFGLVVHAAMLIFVLALPSKNILETYKIISFTVIGVYPLVTLLIGKILLVQEQNQHFTNQLKESEEKFRKAFVTSPDSINITRMKDGMYISVNDGFKRMAGFKDEEVVGKTSYDINIWADTADRDKLVEGLKTEGYVQNLEAKFRLKNGETIYGLMSASVIQLDGEPHILSITRDITERKRIEQERIENEKNYHQIIEGMKDSVFVIDFDGKIIDVNKAAIDSLGYTKEEFLNLTPNDIDDSLSDQQIKNLIDRMESEKLQSFQTTHISKNKKRIPVEITSTLINYRGRKAILSIARDITSWLKAQEALYKSESLLNDTQKLAKVGGWEWDIEQRKMYWTDECFRIHGLNPLEVKNDPEVYISKSLECYNDADKAIAKLNFDRCVKDGIPYDFEFEFTSFNKNKLWIRTKAEPVYLENKIVKVIGNIIDITERVEIMDKLRKSEKRFRELFESMEEGFFLGEIIYDKDNKPVDWRFIDVNPAHGKIMNLPRHQVIGKTAYELFPGLEKFWFDAQVDAALTGIPKTIEGFVSSLGKYYINHLYSPRKGQFACLISDITDRKLAEDALKQSESKFYSLFENSPNAIFISDPNTYLIIDCNQNACKMNGYTKDELIGQSLTVLHPDEVGSEFAKPETRELNLNILKNKKSITVESLHKKKDGTTFPIESSISLITLNGKEVTMGIDRDISARKAIEKELETYRNNLEELVKVRTKEIEWINKELVSEIEKKKQTEILLKHSLDKEKELNQLKSRFISTASHEFRTPLTTILSSAELIQRYGKKWEEEKYKDHLDRITNSVEYLTNLMDDVLTISRIESGKINFAPAEVDLKELCEKVIADIEISDKGNHDLLFNFLSNKKVFFIDPKQMQMIILNLLSNSIKYSDAGAKIELVIQANEETFQIKVTDNGYGISEEDLPHLFEPFYRSLQTESIQGTGLGLTIVKNAVEMHGGTIAVNSKLGKGAAFLINIPTGRNEKNSDS